MKNKLKLKTILIALMIILVPLTSTTTQAAMTIKMTQFPTTNNVRIGNIVTVTVTLTPEEGDAQKEILDRTDTSLKWSKNGVEQTPIRCEEVLPARLSKVTFKLGPFSMNTFIEYSVDLVLAWAVDYHSSVVTFTVYPENVTTTDAPVEELPAWITYVLIGVAVLAILLVLAYLFKKRREI